MAGTEEEPDIVDDEEIKDTTKSHKVMTLKGHKWNVTGCHFHPAGSMLATASWDRTVRIWDVADGKELRRIDRQMHTAPITSVRWHPNGALLATTSADNTTALWDAATGKRMRTMREHFGWVLMCSFAPDRTKFATASWDKTVRLWDPNTGELISTLRGHQKGVWACAFYPMGHTSALLATGGEDCTVRLWDTRSRQVALTLSGGHADAVYDVAWSTDGGTLASSSADKNIVIWDPKAGKIMRMLQGHDDVVKRCAFSPVEQDNGITPLVSTGGFDCRVWDPKSGRMQTSVRVHEHGKEVECVDINTRGDLMATGGRDGHVVISTMPVVQRVAEAPVNRVAHEEWRRTQVEDESWRDEVHRRKQMMLQKQKSVNETTILAGFERDGSDAPVKGAVPGKHGEHPMIARERQADKPMKKTVDNAESLMQRRRMQTDATAEKVAESRGALKRLAETGGERSGPNVADLMAKPQLEQKVKLRHYGLQKQGSKSNVENPKRQSAFANM